jgi:hypothetical protein
MAKKAVAKAKDEDIETDEDIFVSLMTGGKNVWTKEFIEFVLRVGVKHQMRESQGERPLALEHGKWKPISEKKAFDLLAPHKSFGHCHVDPSRAHAGRVATWSFEMLWPDREAQLWRMTTLRAETMGIIRIVKEFRQFQESGVLAESALMDRRAFEQEKVDNELNDAVADRDLEGVMRALAKGADPDCDLGYIGLAAKVATVHDEALRPMLKALIEGGAALEGIEIGNWRSQPPLWAAVREENLWAVELLLELGADPECSYDGRRAIDFPTNLGYDERVGIEIKRRLNEAVARREAAEIEKALGPDKRPTPPIRRGRRRL